MHNISFRIFAMACLSMALAACNEASSVSPDSPAQAVAEAQTPVERGELLVTIGGCLDCHTPKTFGPNGPEPDMERMLSGHPEDVPVSAPFRPAPGSSWTIAANDHATAWSGPWGISFTTNLTPDTLTGLRSGVWTEDIFIQALRTGKHMATARVILPPMPWQMIGQLSDDDIKAIWAYLGTIPAILNHVPDPIPPTGAAAP